MRKNLNSEHIEGYVFDHTLTVKQVQNEKSENYGKNFITGEVNVAVDEAMLNVIPVHFTYVTETTKNGSNNATYAALSKIIDGATVATAGKEGAIKVKIDTSLGLNEFYNNENNLISAKRNEGGFVTIVSSLCDESERNKFTFDMVITGVKHVDADAERNVDEHAVISGVVFDFKNAILPVDLKIKNPAGMSYFEDLGASNAEPVYTKLWGRINCSTVVNRTAEENAFGGEENVTSYERKVREWLVTGTAKAAYDLGDEKILTMEELNTAAQDRQVYLADLKKRNDEYKASRTTAASSGVKATAVPAAKKASGFNF